MSNGFISSKEKKRKRRLAIQEYFNDQETEKMVDGLLEETEKEKRLIEQSETINNTFQRKNSNRKRAIENEIYRKKVKNEMIHEVFNIIVYKSIPLDEDYKFSIKDKIFELTNECFDNIFAKGLIGLKEDSVFYPIVESIEFNLKNVETTSTEEELNEINESINDAIFDYVFFSSHDIKNKITEAVKVEKELTKYKTECINEGKYFNEKAKSIFRKMLEKNSLLDEDTQEIKGITDEIFSDTIIDYTILETFNSLKLVDFNMKNFKNKY